MIREEDEEEEEEEEEKLESSGQVTANSGLYGLEPPNEARSWLGNNQ